MGSLYIAKPQMPKKGQKKDRLLGTGLLVYRT